MSSSPRSKNAKTKNLLFKKYYYDLRAQLEKLGATPAESRNLAQKWARRKLNRRYKK